MIIMNCNLSTDPIELGIGPVNWLFEKVALLNSPRSENKLAGMDP